MKGEIDEEVGQWISIANFCQIYHCLPRPGGMFDQDPTVVTLLSIVASAQHEKEDREIKASQRKAGRG